jgi:hypothetical protein
MSNEKTTDIQPNDVAVILRPEQTDGEYSGAYQVLVAGIGPVTVTLDVINDLIGMATLLASVVPFMEANPDVADKIMEFCNEFYGEDMEFKHEEEASGLDHVLTINSKVVGGVQ